MEVLQGAGLSSLQYQTFGRERLQHLGSSRRIAAADLSIEVKENTAQAIRGNKQSSGEEGERLDLPGIAERNFERGLQLADHVQIKGARAWRTGLPQVDRCKVVPEAMKPRAIPITTAKLAVLEGSGEDRRVRVRAIEVWGAFVCRGGCVRRCWGGWMMPLFSGIYARALTMETAQRFLRLCEPDSTAQSLVRGLKCS